MMCSISTSESPGKARPMLSRARLEMPSRGPIMRASVPPIAEAQSIGSNPNAPKHSAAPHPSSWWVKPIGCRGRKGVPSPTSLGRHPLPRSGRGAVHVGLKAPLPHRGRGGPSSPGSVDEGSFSITNDGFEQLCWGSRIGPADFDLENLDGGPHGDGHSDDVLCRGDQAGSRPLGGAEQPVDFARAVRMMVGERPRADELDAECPQGCKESDGTADSGKSQHPRAGEPLSGDRPKNGLQNPQSLSDSEGL